MKVHDISLTLLKVVLKSGVGKKTGKPYSFYQAEMADEDLNKFNFILGRDVEVEGQIPEEIIEAKKVPCHVDIEFLPKGFDIGGTIVRIDFD